MWAANAKAAKDIPLDGGTVTKGSDITITYGREEKYAIWHHTGVYDLPIEYVSEIKPMKNLSEQTFE